MLTIILSVAASNLVDATTILAGGTVIAWDEVTHSLETIRSKSIVVEDGMIAAIFSGRYNGTLPADVEIVDATNDIISTGFMDTHTDTAGKQHSRR